MTRSVADPASVELSSCVLCGRPVDDGTERSYGGLEVEVHPDCADAGLAGMDLSSPHGRASEGADAGGSSDGDEASSLASGGDGGSSHRDESPNVASRGEGSGEVDGPGERPSEAGDGEPAGDGSSAGAGSDDGGREGTTRAGSDAGGGGGGRGEDAGTSGAAGDQAGGGSGADPDWTRLSDFT